MLNDPKRTSLAVKTTDTGARYVNPPRFVNDTMGSVLVVEFEGEKVER